MTLTYQKVPSPVPGARWYHVRDSAGRLRGLVAGLRGYWIAARPGPRRSEPWVPVARAETRDAAARRLVEGRP